LSIYGWRATWASQAGRQTGSNGYLSIALVNGPQNIAARFVREQLIGLEVANRAFEFIDNARLNSAIGECYIHRAIEMLVSRFAFANAQLSANCASKNKIDNSERPEGWLSPV